MHERFIIRQKIIDYLFEKVSYNNLDVPFLGNTTTPLKKIALDIGVPYKKVFRYHHGIPDDQAKCIIETKEHSMMLIGKGINAAIERYWLREGQKEANEIIYDRTKWIVPLIALMATLGSLTYTIYNTINTQRKVSRLEEQIITLKNQTKQIADTLNKRH